MHLFDGLVRGDRYALSRCITLVESERPEDREQALLLLDRCIREDKPYFSVAISGSPGVGKSTFIETIGLELIKGNQRLAVLTVDPSSHLSKGSILGDKTRMPELSKSQGVYVRPSSNQRQYGGLAPATWESILLCATAGHEMILLETVGVGQSEIQASQLADMIILLLQPGAGDDLQGVKRGILETAHVLVVHKDDGEYQSLASRTANHFSQHLTSMGEWQQRLIRASSLSRKGINELLTLIDNYRELDLSKLRLSRSKSWLATRSEHDVLLAMREQHKDFLLALDHQLDQGEINVVQALLRFRDHLQNDK